jgi:glycosyltransferase involved in cell wall biosynthesis
MEPIASPDLLGRLEVLVVSFSDLGRDPRVDRQLEWLHHAARLAAIGCGPTSRPNVEYHGVSKPIPSLQRRIRSAAQLSSRSYEQYYWQRSDVDQTQAWMSKERFDVVIANDIDALPVAVERARGAKVIFDAHEYAPREHEHSAFWRLMFQRYRQYLCRRYIPRVHGMTTVSPAIADAYQRDTGVVAEIITNAPPLAQLAPSPHSGDRVRLVHHGAAIASRHIEKMIDVANRLPPNYTLDLMLVESSPGYMRRLRKLASNNPRVRFRDPVPMPEIARALNEYDVGLCLIEPSNFNYLHALPNKLFEFIQARLAVVVGPSPAMAGVVREHQCGVVASDFDVGSVVRCVLEMEPRIGEYKTASDQAAKLLNAEVNGERFIETVARTLDAGGKTEM